jgi:Ca-activated chloride channel family protein
MTDPRTGTQFTAATDRTLLRAGVRSTRHILYRITAPTTTTRRARLPLNLAIVLDRSGSMSGGKLKRVVTAARAALRHLGPADRFSVVSYDAQITVDVASTMATPMAVEHASDLLGRLQPGGSTALAEGWLRGAEQVALHADGGEALQRVLLLTDGQANVGERDPARLAEQADGLRHRGIRTSTFGVGHGFDEHLLSAMAEAGGGNFHYLDTAESLEQLLAAEVGEALEVTLPQVTLTIDADCPARIALLDRWPLRSGERWGSVVIDLGDLVAGQVLECVAAVTFPEGRVGQRTEVRSRVVSRGETIANAAVLDWEWASHAENDVQPRDRIVDRATARRHASRARNAGLGHNRRGELRDGSDALAAVARRVAEYAGDDVELRNLVATLSAEAAELGRVILAEPELKSRHRMAYNNLKGRGLDGMAMRRDEES